MFPLRFTLQFFRESLQAGDDLGHGYGNGGDLFLQVLGVAAGVVGDSLHFRSRFVELWQKHFISPFAALPWGIALSPAGWHLIGYRGRGDMQDKSGFIGQGIKKPCCFSAFWAMLIMLRQNPQPGLEARNTQADTPPLFTSGGFFCVRRMALLSWAGHAGGVEPAGCLCGRSSNPHGSAFLRLEAHGGDLLSSHTGAML